MIITIEDPSITVHRRTATKTPFHFFDLPKKSYNLCQYLFFINI